MDYLTGFDILIVEDDPDIALLLARIFQIRGYTSCWAPDGPQALDLLAAHRPDLVTLDVNMPMLSGLEVLAQVRTNPQLAQLPVLVLTSREDLPPQVYTQASAVMLKPFDVVALLAAADDLLAAAPARARSVGE